MDTIQINRVKKTNVFSLVCIVYILCIFLSKVYLNDNISLVILIIHELLFLTNFIVFKLVKNKKNYPIIFTALLLLLNESASISKGIYIFTPFIINFTIIMTFALLKRKRATLIVLLIIFSNQILLRILFNHKIESNFLTSHTITHILITVLFFYIKKSQDYLEFLFTKKNLIDKKKYINIINSLKTPIAIIKAKIELFSKKTNKNNNIESLKDSVEIMERNLISIIKMEVTGDDKPNKNIRSINLSNLLTEYLTQYKILFEKSYTRLLYHIEENIFIFAERADLLIIFNNLLNYFLSYNGDKETIFISIVKEDFYALFSIEVKDNDLSKNITNDIGFSMIHQICNKNNFQINFDENNPAGNSITLKLPLSNKTSTKHSYLSDEIKSPLFSLNHNGNKLQKRYKLLIINKHFELQTLLYEYFSKSYSIILSSKIENIITKIDNTIDIIIIDKLFPSNDDNIYIQQIRSLAIPVIFITSKCNNIKNKLRDDSIVAAYIEKPFSLNEMELLINNFILLKNRVHDQVLENVVNKIQHFNNSENIIIEKQNIQSETLLTKKEKIIVERLSVGDSQKIIAYELGISVNTVKSHIQRIYRKYEVNNVTSLLNKVHIN